MQKKIDQFRIIPIILGLVLCTSLIGQAVAQNNTTAVHKLTPADAGILLNPNVNIIIVDPAIKNATPYQLFLVVDNEGKATWLNDINNADIATSEKKQAQDNMTKLWNKYPVKFTQCP